VEKDLLSEEQSQVFIDMIREIVKQVKANPKQMPTVTIPHKYRQVSPQVPSYPNSPLEILF
jgi:hypothetical protein